MVQASDIGLTTIKSLSVVVTLMFFGGTIQVMSYYQEFGFRFSDLGIEYHHILFRGISLTFTNLPAALVVSFCFMMIMLDYSGYAFRVRKRTLSLGKAQGLAIALCFPMIFVIASTDGYWTAQRDSTPATTTLRELVQITKTGTDESEILVYLKGRNPRAQARVFIVHRTSGMLSVIRPPKDAQLGAGKPTVFHIQLNSGDTYVDTASNNLDSSWLSLF